MRVPHMYVGKWARLRVECKLQYGLKPHMALVVVIVYMIYYFTIVIERE